MKTLIVMILILSLFILVECKPTIELPKGAELGDFFKSIAPEPPFGISVISIEGKEYIIVRTKLSYGEAVAICPKPQ